MLAITLADFDDSPSVFGVVPGVASSPLVSPVLCGKVDVRVGARIRRRLRCRFRLPGSAVLAVLSRPSPPRWRWTSATFGIVAA